VTGEMGMPDDHGGAREGSLIEAAAPDTPLPRMVTRAFRVVDSNAAWRRAFGWKTGDNLLETLYAGNPGRRDPVWQAVFRPLFAGHARIVHAHAMAWHADGHALSYEIHASYDAGAREILTLFTEINHDPDWARAPDWIVRERDRRSGWSQLAVTDSWFWTLLPGT
jgi:hypothetical protein